MAKLLTTGMGETIWDGISVDLGQILAVTLSGAGLVAAVTGR